MKFLVIWKVFETITQEQAKPLRGGFGQQLDQLFDSPKIKDVGIFGAARGGYMILDDVNSADEISAILGPEILDNSYVESHPIASVEETGEQFRQWAEQGR
jgi:hypothetical protein